MFVDLLEAIRRLPVLLAPGLAPADAAVALEVELPGGRRDLLMSLNAGPREAPPAYGQTEPAPLMGSQDA